MLLNVDEVDLAGQVALVTGGGRGIGRATALALARAGAAVAVTARTEEEIETTARLIREHGWQVLTQPTDVTDLAAVEALVQRVEAELGPLSLLVNNAALIGDYGPAWEAEPALWWRVMEVNVLGPFLVCRAALPGMTARRRGRVVNLSSGVAFMYFPHGSAYAVSKAAVERFTENLAGEAGPYGLSVFAVGPGTVRTAMTEHVLQGEAGRKWQPELQAIFAEGQDVPPEQAANLIVFLASGQADALSGCYLEVEHDLPALVRQAEQVKREDRYVMRLRT